MGCAGGCPILVVEDDRDIREGVSEILLEEGYPAQGAAHGLQALALLRAMEPAPCLILLDLMMPVMDGFEFRAQQLEDPLLRAIPVVVMTAARGAEESAKKLEAGWLRKPIELQRLLEVVGSFCAKRAP